MDFLIVAQIFEELGKTSKRLHKILILRDFLEQNITNDYKNTINLFDIISGNFQRKINKKQLGISLKTVSSAIGFIANKTERDVEKKFNKLGDIGEIAVEFLSKSKQTNLISKKLTFEEIIKSFEEMVLISGTNSNKRKKEIISKLFMSANSNEEYKFLARLLIDDLRIGVSVGVLKEAFVNFYFPKLIEIHTFCPTCNYYNLSDKKCFKCKKEINIRDQFSIIEENSSLEILNFKTPKEIVGLNNFIGEKSSEEEFKLILRTNKNKFIIKHENPREIYNKFISLFEKKYNLLNSFEKISKELKQDLLNVMSAKIEIGNPILSMLGTRSNTVKNSFEVSEKPAIIDYKYDGLRMQVHNDKGKVTLFSRNLDNITKQFPDVVEYFKTNFSDISFIVDSECVGFDFKKLKFLPFQTLSRRIMSKEINDVSHINVVVKSFDIMYLNGKTLIEVPYFKRREELKKLFLNRKLKQKIHFDIKQLNKFRQNFEYD